MENEKIVDSAMLEKALDEIKESYDAFYFANKYDDNNEKGTHAKQFNLLATLPGLSLDKGALCWIKNQYDRYYKDDYKDETGTAFEYIRNIIRKEK
jgi:hypothetical protein